MSEAETLQELRSKARQSPRRSFMGAVDLQTLRNRIIKTTQARLAEQLLRPDTGKPITQATFSRYEKGAIPIPQWVAQQVLTLAEAARRYDAQR